MNDECVISVTDEEFEAQVLRHPGTVLVDFYTAWCPPCKHVAPIVEELCREKRSALKVVKMDAVENPRTATEHRILSVPNFVLFHAGKRVGQLPGAHSKAQFEKWIASSVIGAD